jgi:predicted hotdog family 3-hydroxylacyl-ACP dehydratase
MISWSMAELLPHQAPMILLDRVLAQDDQGVRVAARIGPDHPFLEGDLVAAHVGIELMAQACGVFAGLEAKMKDAPVRLGFLLGTRKFSADVAGFLLGVELEITARVVFRDMEMAVFDCIIEGQGAVLASAQLTLYQPKDMEAALGAMGHGG